MELAGGGKPPRSPKKNEKMTGGQAPQSPRDLTGGQAPQTPRGFPRVLGTMTNRGLIHAISSSYENKILDQNIRSNIRSKY